MNNSPHGYLVRVLIILTSLLVIVTAGTLIYVTVGKDLTWPEPLPTVTYRPSPTLPADDLETANLGINAASGLALGPGFKLVKQNCTVCHSAKLITQNRATREGWATMIDWMQAKQGLWELGENEPAILDYLATHYGVPENVGRRSNLEEIEWYVLDLEGK